MNNQTFRKSSNNISSVLKVFAYIVFFSSFILGTVLGGSGYKFNFTTALITWLVGGITGMVWLAFAEIIILLQSIFDGLTFLRQKPTLNAHENKENSFSDLPKL